VTGADPDALGAPAEPVKPVDSTNAISGIVGGHSVQAAVVHGGIHFHGADGTGGADGAAGAGGRAPYQLLATPAHFTGRDAELTELDDIVSSSLSTDVPALVVLSGPGGVGKTALALRWAHGASGRFADGQLYIDLAGFSAEEPVDPGEALGQFLRALGVPAQQVPASLSEQATMFRSLTAQRSLLVLLDNAYSAAQARALLPASPRSAVLVTSRSRLTGLVGDGARLLEVRPLEPTAAVTLLARTVGDGRVDGEPDPAATLVRMCGGLPIALRLAAARLAARPRWSVARLVTELADERDRLVALSAQRDPSVQATFDLSYQVLPAQSAALYRRIGLHPGREFGSAVGASALGCSPSEADQLLDGLVEANLVEEIREDRYRLHDLLRLHARQRTAADDPPHERNAALRRMLEWYLAAAAAADRVLTPYRRRLPHDYASEPGGLPVFAGREWALSWLEDERVNLMAAGQAAMTSGWFGLAWQLCDVMWPLLLYRKHYRDRAEIDRRGLDAAREWGNGYAEASMLGRLGRVCTTLGRHDDAERHLRASIARWSDLGDRHGVADAQENLGLLYLDTGRTADAVAEFEQVQANFRALGNDRRVGVASINLAIALPRIGRTRQALDHIEEARAIFDRLVDIDPYNGARTRVAAARLHCALDDIDAASEAATDGLHAMRRLGSEYGEAEAHEVLAEAELRRGDLAAARHHFDRAATTFSALRSPRLDALRARLGPMVYPQK